MSAVATAQRESLAHPPIAPSGALFRRVPVLPLLSLLPLLLLPKAQPLHRHPRLQVVHVRLEGGGHPSQPRMRVLRA